MGLPEGGVFLAQVTSEQRGGKAVCNVCWQCFNVGTGRQGIKDAALCVRELAAGGTGV